MLIIVRKKMVQSYILYVKNIYIYIYIYIYIHIATKPYNFTWAVDKKHIKRRLTYTHTRMSAHTLRKIVQW